MISLQPSHTVSKKRLFAEWLGVVTIGTVLFVVLGVARFMISYEAEPNVDWNPWADIPSLLAFAPFAWIFFCWVGPLWAALGGLIGLLKTGKRSFHYLTGASASVFTFIWPEGYWAIMSV